MTHLFYQYLGHIISYIFHIDLDLQHSLSPIQFSLMLSVFFLRYDRQSILGWGGFIFTEEEHTYPSWLHILILTLSHCHTHIYMHLHNSSKSTVTTHTYSHSHPHTELNLTFKDTHTHHHHTRGEP